MSSAVMTLSPFSQAGVVDDDVIAMVMAASRDPVVRGHSYLVQALDEKGALAYCQGHDGVVVRYDGTPLVAVIVYRELPPLAGLAVPAGSVELDAWALAPARGKGLFGKQGGWPLVAAWLSQRFDHALSVVFSDNEPGQAHARSIGGTWIGRTYLPSRDIPGFRDGEVDVYVHELARYRPSQGTSP